jgi:chorismate mutase
MKLEEWRSEIDEIDSEITALLERRAKISRKIGVLKARAGLPVADPGREENIIRRLNAKSSGALPAGSLGRIYRRILQESRAIQAEAIGAPAAAVKNGVEGLV